MDPSANCLGCRSKPWVNLWDLTCLWTEQPVSWIKDKAKYFHEFKLETVTQSISSNCWSGFLFFSLFFPSSFKKVLWNNWNLSGLEVKNEKYLLGLKSVVSSQSSCLWLYFLEFPLWNCTASSLGFVVRGFGYGYTHATALIFSSCLSALPVCIQTPWLTLCKIHPVTSSLLLLTAVFHTALKSDTILNPVNWCCLCWKARKQLSLLPYPISIPDHTKQLV